MSKYVMATDKKVIENKDYSKTEVFYLKNLPSILDSILAMIRAFLLTALFL